MEPMPQLLPPVPLPFLVLSDLPELGWARSKGGRCADLMLPGPRSDSSPLTISC
jgi:hypothetical protein